MAWFDRLTTLFAVGVAGSSALPLAAGASWYFELFTHFRLQYIVLLLVAILIFILRRRRLAAATLVPFVLYTAWIVAIGGFRFAPADEDTAALKIVNANVNSANPSHERLIDYMIHEYPDIAVLLEIDESWSEALDRLDKIYPFRVERSQEGNFGITMLSRIPLEETAVRDLLGTPAVTADVIVDGRRLRVMGVHLRSPTSPSAAAQRDEQLEELGRWISEKPGPTIAVGDYNQSLYSPIFSDWLAEHGLVSSAQTRLLPVSWPTFLPLLGIVIDHYVVTEQVVIGDYARGPSIGSDHYPLTSTITLKGNE